MANKKFLFITASLILASHFTIGQDYRNQFKDLSNSNDIIALEKVLSKWELVNPKDPELFIAYFNYFISKSRTEVISIDRNVKDTPFFVIRDTGTGKPVAYLGSSSYYNSQNLQKGFDYIDKGILAHPSRLDMRFGKIHMLGEVEDYPAFTKEIIEAIEYGNKIKDAWLWKEGELLKNPKQFFLESVQDYIGTIYNTQDDSLLPLMRQISEAAIKYYPDHVQSLSNIALTYLVIGDYEKAMPYLLKAETLAPKDIVVLNNI